MKWSCIKCLDHAFLWLTTRVNFPLTDPIKYPERYYKQLVFLVFVSKLDLRKKIIPVASPQHILYETIP